MANSLIGDCGLIWNTNTFGLVNSHTLFIFVYFLKVNYYGGLQVEPCETSSQ